MFIEESLKQKAKLYFNLKQKHMGDMLGITFKHIAKDKIVATMPVNEHSVQPFGILHGGASVALAESVCSLGGWFLLEDERKAAVGLEINANHIRSVKMGGKVTATANPIHIGKTTQIWECELRNERDKLVCASRCTLAIIEK